MPLEEAVNETGPPEIIEAANLNYSDAGGDDDIYVDAAVEGRYEKDYGRYVLGVSSPNGFKGRSSAAVQLFAPTLLYVVDWSFAATGAQPKIPDPSPQDDEWFLLDEHLEPSAPATMPDGYIKRWRISGTYVYGRLGAPDYLPTVVSYPKLPWMDQLLDRRLRSDVYDRSILQGDSGGGVMGEGIPIK